MKIKSLFKTVLLCAMLVFSQVLFAAANYQLVVFETANPTNQFVFDFLPESPGNSNYIATAQVSGSLSDYSCCMKAFGVMSSNVYDLSSQLSTCTSGVFSVKTDVNNTSRQLYNFNCVNITATTVYGMTCWDAPIVGGGRCEPGNPAAAGNNIFTETYLGSGVYVYSFKVESPTAGFKMLFSEDGLTWDWSNELGRGGSVLTMGIGMKPQGGNGDLSLDLNDLETGENVKLTLEKNGLNYVLSAISVNDPELSYVGDDCSSIKFKIDNFDSNQYYEAKLNNAIVSLGTGGTYTVSNPTRGVEYEFSVVASKDGLMSNVVSLKHTLPLDVVKPIVTASAGCNSPVKFTIENYDRNLTYNWRINGAPVSVPGDSYIYSSPVNGVTYKAVVEVADGCTTQTSDEASQTYLATPTAPSVSANAVQCNGDVIFTIDNYDQNLTYSWTLNVGTGVASGENYIVSAPQDRTDYSVSVTAGANGCISDPGVGVSQYLKTPETPVLSVSHDCGEPIKFKLENASSFPATYTQEWKINGNVVTPVMGEFSLVDIVDGGVYSLQVNVKNSRNGKECVSTTGSVSQEAMLKPAKPIVAQPYAYRDCQKFNETGYWADLVEKTDPSYTIGWYTSEDLSSPVSYPPHSFNKGIVGTSTYWVVQKRSDDCISNPVKVSVRVDQIPVAITGPEKVICQGTSAVLAEGLTEETDFTYSWSPNDVLLVNNQYSVTTRELSQDTEFTLTVSNAENPVCKGTASVWVRVRKKPVVTLDNTMFTVCKGENVTVANTTADPSKESYIWSSSPGATNAIIPYPTLSTIETNPLESDQTLRLKAYLTDLPTCYSEQEANVIVKLPPVIDAGPDKSVCYGSDTRIGSEGVSLYSYKWAPEDKLNDPTVAMPMVQNVTEDINFRLEASLKSLPHCKSESFVTVSVVPLPVVYNVIGGGKYCDGSIETQDVSINSSDSDTQYLLLRNGSPVGDWVDGVNGILTWSNVNAGTYTVKARKKLNPECQIEMNGSALVESIQSPDANIFIKDGRLACPGDKITIRIEISNGDGTCAIKLLKNEVEEYYYTNEGFVEFDYTAYKATKFEIVSIKDNVCEKIYAPEDYPTLDLNVPNYEEFQIHSSNNDNPVCFGEQVQLCVDYTGGGWMWPDGSTGRCITTNADKDVTYDMLVTTPEGCNVPVNYTLQVIEKVPFEITGLNKYKEEVDELTGKTTRMYYQCSSDGDVILGAVPAGGAFSSDPPGVMDGATLKPYNAPETRPYTIKYEWYETASGSGCRQDTSFVVHISALNKEIGWTTAPAFDPPWGLDPITICQPHADNPKQSIKLQGNPAVPSGTWELYKTTKNDGTAAADGAVISPITGVADGTTYLSGITAGHTYQIRYSVKDQYECESVAERSIIVENKEQFYIDSKGFGADPSFDLCKNQEEATIYTNYPIGNFTLSADDQAMFVSQVTDAGKIVINPKKGKLGTHTLIHKYQLNEGCSFQESVNFTISEPIRIQSFNIPSKYCEGDAPVEIKITSEAMTDGHIMIINQDGDVILDKTLINTPPMFDPSVAGTYTIIYEYNDGICESTHEETVTVLPSPEIIFNLKSDYCLGEVVLIEPNYLGGDFKTDAPDGTLIDKNGRKAFDTSVSGLGVFKLEYEVKSSDGCSATAETSFQVRGVDPMSLVVEDYYCEPFGVVNIEGFPKSSQADDVVKFSSDRFNGITDNGDGTATIDLSKAVYNTSYPLTYHYIQSYTDANGDPQTCETTVTEIFRVLNEGSDFSGFADGEVICSDVESIKLVANHSTNTSFTFSHISQYPNAFVDNGDGTAYLYPKELPEGVDYYEVVMSHKYTDENGFECSTQKTKTFSISVIQEINDISLYCEPTENKTAVKLEHSELGIRYDLVVNGVVVESVQSVADGSEILFSPLDITVSANVKIVAVDPSSVGGCTLHMTKEHNIKPFLSYVVPEKISCYNEVDGKFYSVVEGGEYEYKHTLTDITDPNNRILISADSTATSLPKGKYEYRVEDRIGCYRINEFEITEPNELTAYLKQDDVNCSGQSTASISAIVNAGAGTSPYQYEWTNLTKNEVVGTNSSIENCSAGLYEVLITDANKCFKKYQTTIDAPERGLTVTLVNKVDVLIIGDATGEIEIAVEGGTQDATGEYSYAWFGESINSTNYNLKNQTGLKANTYKVIVTDAKGCQVELVVDITEPIPFDVKYEVNNVTCNGANNGSIFLDVTGGSQGYTYEWTYPDGTTETSDDITGLAPSEDPYKLIIRDSNNNEWKKDFYITEPPLLSARTAVSSKLELNCKGDNDGEIRIKIEGGISQEYQVTWQGLTEDQIVDDTHVQGLIAGTYIAKVQDKNGCEYIYKEDITEPLEELKLLSETIVQNRCHDGNEGFIELELQGGTGAYDFVWTGDGVNPNSNSQSTLKAGKTYTVEVTDDKDCKWNKSYTMDNPDELSVVLTPTNLTCKSSQNGSIKATVVGGVQDYKYIWKDASSTQIPNSEFKNEVSSLDAGLYTLEVVDHLGCQVNASITLTEPEELTAVVERKDISCYGGSDGSLEVIPSGGTRDYTYKWYKLPDRTTPFSTESKIDGIKIETTQGYQDYIVEVTDANNCTWSASSYITINEPSPIKIESRVQNVAVNGEATGSINLVITGGQPGVSGYKVEWIRGESIIADPADPNFNKFNEDIDNLLSGSYEVRVVDENGCEAFATIEVTQPEVISVDVEVGDVKCFGSNQGYIKIKDIQGGDSQYTVSWSGLTTGFTSNARIISGLEADTYLLVVTDVSGAKFEKEYVVNQPDAITIETLAGESVLSVKCFEEKTGKITVNITGGTMPYEYKWTGTDSPYNNQAMVENLVGGHIYGINLVDANGCTHTTFLQRIEGPLAPLEITEHMTNAKCFEDNNASIELMVTGGYSDYEFYWSGGPGLVTTDQNQYTLRSGETYTVQVTDKAGCTKTETYTFDQRKELLMATSKEDVKCYGDVNGKLTAIVSGGTGNNLYSKWESLDGTHVFTGLIDTDRPAGKYKFTVTDDAGCVKTSEETILSPDKLEVEIKGSSVLCSGKNDGVLSAIVTGGTGYYNYTWKEGNTVVGGGSEILNLGEGSYQVIIEDTNGCSTTQYKGIVSSSPMRIDVLTKVDVAIHGEDTGLIEVDVTGGTDPIEFFWVGGGINPDKATEQNQSDLIAGTYIVTAIDGVGCQISEEIEITQPETITVKATIKDIKCFGETGTITLTVDGGYQEYLFEWTGPNGYAKSGIGPEFSEISGLLPGKYEVKITDNYGLGTSEFRPYNISDKRQLTWIQHESKTELDCAGKNDAYINLEVSGGTQPYSIVWHGPDGFTKEGVYSIAQLSVGTYYADITDANGCNVQAPFVKTITSPDPLTVEAVLTHNTCATDKSGAIDLTVNGGTPGYNYVWSGFNVEPNKEDQENLPKGKYTLALTDSKQCKLTEEFIIQANNEIDATISGPESVCSEEEFEIQIDLNGTSPWKVKYTDGTQVHEVDQTENSMKYPHSLTSDAVFNLVEVIDNNGCAANLIGRVSVDVHEVPSITIVSTQEDCCLGEAALVDIIFAGKGPWTIHYNDGTQNYVGGPFTTERNFLEIVPTQIGTKTYTIESVSNDNCAVEVGYSFDVTTYSYPNLHVEISPYECEPTPLKMYLHATGEPKWHVVYYLNGLKYEEFMEEAELEKEIVPNKTDNLFRFESITSGTNCVTKLDKEISARVGLKPKDAKSIIGQNLVCRNSIATFETAVIEHAQSYEWILPQGFTIVSGLGSSKIEVEIDNESVGGYVEVRGVNECGVGVSTKIEVMVDMPMSTDGVITMPPYVCDNNSIFVLSVSKIENATNYEWIMPTGYTLLSGQGTQSVMVQIDKFALSNDVTVIPSNSCTEGEPVTAKVVIRQLPSVEAGVDFITNCLDYATLAATPSPNAVATSWELLSGNGEFESPSSHNSKVTNLMYGENLLKWKVDDGYCVAADIVKVTNQNPGITDPEFDEITICEDYITLRAAEPEFGMGRWTLIAGDGEIENPNNSEALITGLSNKRTNVIRWEVYSPQCSNTRDIKVISHDLTSLVDAGEDGISTNGSYRLSARTVNNIDVEGTWTVVGGEGVIANPHNPNTTVEGLASGINTLRWTLRGYDCEAYDEVRIRMVDEPVASFNIETAEGCEPLTVLFTNTTLGEAEYKWEFGDGSTSDIRNPEHVFEKAGTYTVKLTAIGDKRVDVTTGIVNVLPKPKASFSVADRQLYVPNAEAHFYNGTSEAIKYHWDFGDGGTSDKENPVYTYVEDGLYDVTYIVSDINLCSDTLVMEKYINVAKQSFLVFPTAFTPNVEYSNGGLYSEGERRLDVFYPVSRNVDTYKLEIFSSWGVKVFESNDLYIGWDGYYLGKCAVQGTYVYRAEGRYKDGTAFQYSGNLMLIR